MNNTIKVKRENLVDQVSELLKELIIKRKWDVGEKLPSENDFAAMFDVSRLTIRLALQKLSALGILETRVGEGTFVKEFDFGWYVNEASDIIIKPGMLDDVQEFRRLIEIESGRLAILNASDVQLKELEECAKSLDKFTYDNNMDIKYNVEIFVKKDYDFHLKLCEISNNSLLFLAFLATREPITQYLKTIVESRWELYFSKDKINKSNSIRFPSYAHYELYLAIKDNDFERFKDVYYTMVNYKETDYYKD